MIKKLLIKNFKSIKSLNISFKQLNLLCGENASGKTSVIHALLAVVQKKRNNKNLDGEIIKIGSLSELKNYNSGSEIVIEISAEDEVSRKIILKRNSDLTQPDKDILITEPMEESSNIDFEKEVFYLSSNRQGVMDIYSKGNSIFGINGEAAISFLSEHKEDIMPSVYMTKFKNYYKDAPISENAKFYEHVRFWLEKITNEVIKIESVPYTNQYVLTYGRENSIRPINTGSGFSYILPIIIICLGSILNSKNPTIIIENPEIYLHPQAQFYLTDFFLFFSEYEQLIIETHSEHLLKAVMEHQSKNNQVLVFNCENKISKVEILNSKSFKTKPISYPEVLYRAFGIHTIELHILLYSMLQEQCNKKLNLPSSSIKAFDDWLIENFPSIPQKRRTNKGTVYNTLPSYIRHCIDHPEQKDISTEKKYIFTNEELKISIDFLLMSL
jgi:predicted ATPase